jgi:predicted ATPase
MLPGSEQIKAPIEKNYIDLLNQLRLLPLQKPTTNQAISALSEVLGGEVQEEGDKYYLVDVTGRRTGISMIAEGLRKFGTLQKLLANGSLTKSNTLYWDEPEANLNPALLRKLAAILAELARQGFQIILATHSMSLLKEFHILSREPDKEKLPIKYFGLNAEPGQPTTVVTRDDFKYLPDVVALEVELDQADDLEEIFARESR